MEIDFIDGPEQFQKVLKSKVEQFNLINICEHNLISIIRHSKVWRYPDLKTIIKKTNPHYSLDRDSLFFLVVIVDDYHDYQMSLVEIGDFRTFKRFEKDTSECGFKIF